jgi:GNAT superfamily N-acetyltransferase
VIGACEAVLVCELGHEWIRAGSSVRVERIERLEQVEDYRRVNRAVYGDDRDTMADELAESLRIGSQQHRGYVAYADSGEPVSIGRLYTHPRSVFGGLYGGATLQAFRGRGYYKAMVAARARDAAAAGVRYLSVDARPTSRPILEKIGFVRVTDTWPCEWSP